MCLDGIIDLWVIQDWKLIAVGPSLMLQINVFVMINTEEWCSESTEIPLIRWETSDTCWPWWKICITNSHLYQMRWESNFHPQMLIIKNLLDQNAPALSCWATGHHKWVILSLMEGGVGNRLATSYAATLVLWGLTLPHLFSEEVTHRHKFPDHSFIVYHSTSRCPI